ncbi:MAG: hypothetical protein GY827_08450 [Cytophagales bacterium]|nr:hypothetical protein [Cytophagales bacterium]
MDNKVIHEQIKQMQIEIYKVVDSHIEKSLANNGYVFVNRDVLKDFVKENITCEVFENTRSYKLKGETILMHYYGLDEFGAKHTRGRVKPIKIEHHKEYGVFIYY